jgi:flagellar protein FlaG
MNIEALGATSNGPSRANEPAQQVERKRQESQQQAPSSPQEESKMQPEELLSQIKSITQDGLYSVRFERDSGTEELIVKIVDSDTDEVIRQIPPEELINLSKQLKELSGNLVNTVS